MGAAGVSVAAMFNAISISSLFVLDQDEALEFYVGKLGLEVHTDADIGFMRWLTINVPGDPGRQILLERPGAPSMDDATADEVREHVTKGVAGSVMFTTDDCRKTYEQLAAKDVEITQEPMERPYGVDMAIRDPFGNHLRITQPAAVQPTEAELRDAFTS
jgi:predicted enzyme related to lactoylglutathione lyase